MDIKVSGRKTTVTDALRARVEEKIGEACKVFDIEPMTVDVVLRYEKNPSNPNPAIVEVTVRARGSVIRVAECAGVDAVVVPKHRGCGVTDAVSKTSAGAVQYVKVAKVTNINDAVRYLKEEGVTVFATDMEGEDIYSANLTGDIAVVIGGEGGGVHRLTKKLADGVISIPQFGKLNSLNASVAAGIVVYEAVRQRTK